MGVRREGWRCVPSTGKAQLGHDEIWRVPVSIIENDGLTQRVITITDPKVITTLIYHKQCTSLMHIHTMFSLVRFTR